MIAEERIWSYSKRRYLKQNEYIVKDNDIYVYEYKEMKILDKRYYRLEQLLNITTIDGSPIYVNDKVSYILKEKEERLTGIIEINAENKVVIVSEPFDLWYIEEVDILSVIEEKPTVKKNDVTKIGIRFNDNDFGNLFKLLFKINLDRAVRKPDMSTDIKKNILNYIRKNIFNLYKVASCNQSFKSMLNLDTKRYLETLVKKNDIFINKEVDNYLLTLDEDTYYWDNSEFLLIDYESYNGLLMKII